jgi:hypothetical protein
MKVDCPNCQSTFEANLTAEIPREQTLAIKLTSESDFFPAATIAGAIENMRELLEGIAQNMGQPVSVFVKEIDLKPKTFEVRFLICACK